MSSEKKMVVVMNEKTDSAHLQTIWGKRGRLADLPSCGKKEEED